MYYNTPASGYGLLGHIKQTRQDHHIDMVCLSTRNTNIALQDQAYSRERRPSRRLRNLCLEATPANYIGY